MSLSAIQVQSVVTEHPKPLFRSEKEFPPRHRGQGDLCVLTKSNSNRNFMFSKKKGKINEFPKTKDSKNFKDPNKAQ